MWQEALLQAKKIMQISSSNANMLWILHKSNSDSQWRAFTVQKLSHHGMQDWQEQYGNKTTSAQALCLAWDVARDNKCRLLIKVMHIRCGVGEQRECYLLWNVSGSRRHQANLPHLNSSSKGLSCKQVPISSSKLLKYAKQVTAFIYGMSCQIMKADSSCLFVLPSYICSASYFNWTAKQQHI